MEAQRHNFRALSNIYVRATNMFSRLTTLATQQYFTAEILAAFRRPLASFPLKFAPGQPRVALHVRRGDLSPGYKGLVPNSYYYDVVEIVRQHVPSADIHVWSSMLRYAPPKNQRFWNESEFDGYRARGMAVHLDDPDYAAIWAHFSRAHIFIMG